MTNATARTALSANATRLLAYATSKATAFSCAIAAQDLGLSLETVLDQATLLVEAGLTKMNRNCSLQITAAGKQILLTTPLTRKIVVSVA